MPLAVELAMSIVQLTAVLIPLLLGITRYYINNQENNQIELSDGEVMIYMGLLFMPLLLAYTHSVMIFNAYGNHYLTIAVLVYGAFLTLLFAGIPYMLGQKWAAYFFGGVSVLLLAVSYLMAVILW